MSKPKAWILIGTIATALLALRLAIPDGSRVPPQARDTGYTAPVTTPGHSPVERPFRAILQPVDAAPEARDDVAPETRPAADTTIAAARAQARTAKHFADVQIPDKETTPAEQLGRIALSFVGVDADAEDVWVSIINDPTMPAEERKNLIEDLNEDGFGDPDHPTPDELPLILNRLDLIASLAPDAIDGVNLAAFAEAHKDLLEMARRLTQ